jgi:multidrug efflux pump subunit AcrA (membrane-fusion protein)
MSFNRTGRAPLLEPPPKEVHRDGWERPPSVARGGSVALRIGVLGLVLAAGAWAYYANVRTDRPSMDMTMRVGNTPFPVALAAGARGPVAGTVTYTGSVAPFNEQDVYPRVTGRIVDMPVYPGDAVRPGQVLARLDDVELSSRLSEAEAMAATAEANRAQMEADLAAARHGIVQMEKELAMVEAELAYARAVSDRSERLFDRGAISRQEYENDRAMAASLDAKREAARARLEQARAMEASARKKLEAAVAMVAQGRAAARTARVVRDYVTIVAPSAGHVVKRLVAPGVLVQPGMAILKIAQMDRVRLQANVGEKDLASIKVGSPVTVTAAGAGQASITARVTSVFPFVDQGPRTAVVEAMVDNAGRRLLPGQYITMQFVTGERSDALSVPRGAVRRLGGKASVWVVQDGRVQLREVTTGLESPERVEITRGLTEGERVVARGHEGLYAGARVAEVSAPAAPPAEDAHQGMPGMTPGTPTEAPHAGH